MQPQQNSQLPQKITQWIKDNRKILVIIAGVAVMSLILAQLLYPGGRLLPLAKVDGIDYGGWQKKNVIAELDKKYKDKKIAIYFGEVKKAQRTPTTDQIGLTVSNQNRIYNVSYPWYVRLVPTSVFWAHHFNQADLPNYERDEAKLREYIKGHMGDSCEVEPIDATLKAVANELTVVSATPGGICELADIEAELERVQPVLDAVTNVQIDVTVVPPEVSDEVARAKADEIMQRLEDGAEIKAGSSTVKIDTRTVISWMDFKTVDGKLTASMNSDRATDYLNRTLGPKVAVAPGVTKIKTRDFVVQSRTNGKPGRTLSVPETLTNIMNYIDGKSKNISAATSSVAPRIEYVRSYSPTNAGLNALLKQFSDDHRGTYGISLIELSGERRRANFNANKQFTAASTYKLFVAYSTLKRVESGKWKWSQEVTGGRNLSQCFDDMIVKSDNPCAETLLRMIGFKEITEEAQALGLKNTTFLRGETPLTTSGDLATFLAILETDQMLSSSSRERLKSAMKRNVFREGIPKGVNGQVGNKVGFLDELLHDAGIVYSPNGKYILTVMTEGSSWRRIADLAKKVDTLRSR